MSQSERVYTVQSLTLEPEERISDAPIRAARDHSMEHELPRGEIVRVVSSTGRRHAYRVGVHPRVVRPIGVTSGSGLPSRRGMIREPSS